MTRATDIVLTIKTDKGAVDVSANLFSLIDFNGTEIVSGDKYYIDKAVSAGAKQKRKQRKPKQEKFND